MNGVYNRKLFIDTARPARQKLAKMGGIMASSSDLLQAAMPPVQPMAPAPMPMPQPMPQPVMMAPVMPAQPMPMAAPAPMPAQPMVQQTPPPAPTQPMAFAPGGSVDAEGRRRRQNRKPVDISKAPTVEQTEGTRGALGILAEMDSGAADAAIARYGSPEAAEKALSEKGQKIDDLAGEDTETAVKATLDAAEVPDTPEGKQEFARQVFGMEDVSDMAEIDRRIVDVLQGNAVGKGADAFAIATLAGLDELKKTQLAKIKAASKGNDYTPERLRQRTIEAILRNPGEFDVYTNSQVDPVKVQQQADILVRSMGSAMTTGQSGSSEFPTMYDSSGKAFYTTDGVNYVDAEGKPYVPPKE
jgi:hypothetical protein